MRKILAAAIVFALVFTLFNSLPTGRGVVNINAGPYTLNMHFSELPKPWTLGGWWDDNWTFRQKLTFNTTTLTENLVAFPVLVTLDSGRIDYAATQDAGEDIRFVDADGVTELGYEIELWNESGTSYVWVKVPQIDAGMETDHIWMYYGNPSSADNQNAPSVWSSDYLMVHHLGENLRSNGSYDDHQDSTSYGRGIEAHMEDSHMNTTGMIGLADGFDGVNDYLESNGDEMNDCDDIGTLELLMKTNDNTSTLSVFNTFENRDRAIWTESGQYHGAMAEGAFSSREVSGGAVDYDWHHVVFSWDIYGGDLFLYVDGNLVDSDSGLSTTTTSRASPTRYGNDEILKPDWPWRDDFDGKMDELRVSSIVRSADWNKAQFMSMSDSFITFESVESEYPYRRNVTVNAGSENLPPGHPVSITFDHAALVSAGKSRADGDDIRIFYWDSAIWIELDRTLDSSSSWNTNMTMVWFSLHNKIDAMESDGDYYIYYGNLLASNPPTNAIQGKGLRSIQSGTITNTANGVTTVPISQVDMTKAFLMFNSRHNNGRPVGSIMSGHIATPTSLEFARSTDEFIPTPITIQWYVVEYLSGVNVQRGVIAAQSSTIMNVGINPVSNVNQAFVTWSKTPGIFDVNWSSDDPVVGELTSNSNLQFRCYGVHSGHRIWWQVVEFTDPNDINVQKGTAPPMTGTDLSVNVTLPTPTDINTTFVLVGFATEGSGIDIGARMLRAQLTDSSTITIDRSISGSMDNITEISWQAVELKDGSMVWGGSENMASGIMQKTVPLAVPVDVNSSIAFASVQPASGQSMGRSPYSGDDVIGVGSVTVALSSTEITMERNNAADETDIGWFVVEFYKDESSSTIGSEETGGCVEIVASVYHVAIDGSDPQEIITSPVVSIDANTPNPMALDIGSGVQMSFTDADPRFLRLGISVVNVSGGERFRFNYNFSAQRSNLVIPSSPSTTYYLHDSDIFGIVPGGKRMKEIPGVGGATMTFDTEGQESFWYAPLFSLVDITLLSPAQDEHITGMYDIQYSVNANATSVTFEYFNGISWTSFGSDPDLDGVYAFDSCQIGDRITDLKAIATSVLNDVAEDIVTGIEIDCTPPDIEITQPTDYSEIEGNVAIQYAVDSDAVTVEFRYDDGQLHTIATEAPPDGVLTWALGNQTFKGVTLRATATDEVGLSSTTQVLGLSTPQTVIPSNKPPSISGVPDIIVHYDYSYNFDLTPYVEDEDTPLDQLVISNSDSSHIWTSPMNNLGLVMNYPQSMLGQTVPVTLWVTDGNGSDFEVVNITILDDYPPEKVNPLPDVSFNEDETVFNVFFTSLNYYFQDIDDNNLYFTSGNKSVRIRINTNDTVDMWAEENWFGFEIITIRATDPTGALVEDVVIVQVNPINDPPTIDDIPEITVKARARHVIDLSGYIHDVDTARDSLNVTVDGKHADIDGFNLTLQYPVGVKGDTFNIIVSDGLNYTSGTIRVTVLPDDEHSLLLFWLILAMLVNFLAWGVYLTLKPKLYGGYLLREDGSLIREISFIRKELVPLGFIRNHVKSKGMSDAESMDLEKCRVTFVHGDSLHFAAISSVKLFKDTIVSMKGALTELEDADFDGFPEEEDDGASQAVLDEFESKIKKMRFYT